MIDAGNLLDLSDQPWVDNMYDSAKLDSTYNGKIYGVVYLQYTWSVMYNTKVFADHNITVPTTYDEFLSICDKLKKAGVTPLALGLKDSWLSSYIPLSMAATAIYRENPNFDADLLAGRTTFAQSPWPQILNDYLDLQKRGYFQPSALGLINTLQGIIFLDIGGALPFVIFLYTSFIQSVPRELEEAAFINGAGPFRTFWSIVFPLLSPGLVS